MILEEMSAFYNPWCFLQQPAHPACGLNSSFRTLLAAIDQGWDVVESTLVMPVEPGKSESYDFTLVKKTTGQIYQITVLATPEVDHFMHRNGYEKSNSKFISQ